MPLNKRPNREQAKTASDMHNVADDERDLKQAFRVINDAIANGKDNVILEFPLSDNNRIALQSYNYTLLAVMGRNNEHLYQVIWA